MTAPTIIQAIARRAFVSILGFVPIFGMVMLAAAGRSAAQPIRGKHVVAELLAEHGSIRPGEPFHLALRLAMEEGWHTYWRNPGDAGMATAIEWELPEGFTAGPILWPTPKRLGEEGEISYGYDGEILLLTEITPPRELPPGREITIGAGASWLVCKEMCIAGKGRLSLTLPVRNEAPRPDPRLSEAFFRTRGELPAPSGPWTARALGRGDSIHLWLAPNGAPRGAHPSELYFFPADPEVIDHSAAQNVAIDPDAIRLTLPYSQYASDRPARLRGILVAPEPWADGRRALWIDVALPQSTDPR